MSTCKWKQKRPLRIEPWWPSGLDYWLSLSIRSRFSSRQWWPIRHLFAACHAHLGSAIRATGIWFVLQLKQKLYASGFPRCWFWSLPVGGRWFYLIHPDLAVEKSPCFERIDGHGGVDHWRQPPRLAAFFCISPMLNIAKNLFVWLGWANRPLWEDPTRWSKTPADVPSRFVEQFLSVGLVSLGKSTLPEFGLTAITESLATGSTHNPWYLDYSTDFTLMYLWIYVLSGWIITQEFISRLVLRALHSECRFF